MKTTTFLFLACVFLAASGCSEDPAPDCIFNGDCTLGQVCLANVCVAPRDSGSLDAGNSDGGTDAAYDTGLDSALSDSGEADSARDGGNSDSGPDACVKTEECERSCSDRIDNDCDGLTDRDDYECIDSRICDDVTE